MSSCGTWKFWNESTFPSETPEAERVLPAIRRGNGQMREKPRSKRTSRCQA